MCRHEPSLQAIACVCSCKPQAPAPAPAPALTRWARPAHGLCCVLYGPAHVVELLEASLLRRYDVLHLHACAHVHACVLSSTHTVSVSDCVCASVRESMHVCARAQVCVCVCRCECVRANVGLCVCVHNLNPKRAASWRTRAALPPFRLSAAVRCAAVCAALKPLCCGAERRRTKLLVSLSPQCATLRSVQATRAFANEGFAR
jgi:hypothetical protein